MMISRTDASRAHARFVAKRFVADFESAPLSSGRQQTNSGAPGRQRAMSGSAPSGHTSDESPWPSQGEETAFQAFSIAAETHSEAVGGRP
jgi:hypothetical protein